MLRQPLSLSNALRSIVRDSTFTRDNKEKGELCRMEDTYIKTTAQLTLVRRYFLALHHNGESYTKDGTEACYLSRQQIAVWLVIQENKNLEGP